VAKQAAAKKAKKKATTRKASKQPKRSSAKKTAKKQTASTTKKSTKKKQTSRKAAAGKSPSKKSTTKKSTAKKSTTKKPATKKSATRKSAAKRSSSAPDATRKPTAKSSTGNASRSTWPRTKATPATRRPAAASPLKPNAPKSPKAVPVTASEEAPRLKTSRQAGLNDKDLRSFRDLLLQKRAQLLGDVDTMKSQAFGSSDHIGEESRMPLHMADLGTDNFEHEFTLGLIENEREVVREIEEALQRIEQKTYGICIATGKAIGKARLRAQPWAKYCYEYTLAQERGRLK
jgi:DnaK suppressor protein